MFKSKNKVQQDVVPATEETVTYTDTLWSQHSVSDRKEAGIECYEQSGGTPSVPLHCLKYFLEEMMPELNYTDE